MPITSAKINTPASLRSELIAIRSESLIDIAGIATMTSCPANQHSIPPIAMLNVADLRDAIRWYEGIGFDVADLQPKDDPDHPPNWALLTCGQAKLMLNTGGDNRRPKKGFSLFFPTDQVDALYARIKDRVDVQYEPKDQFYGMRDFWIFDLNGFILGFGQPLEG